MATILIVDDDVEVLETLAAIVAGAGHSVVTAGNGVSALDTLDTDLPLDLMVTDLVMPELNGFDLARMAWLRRPWLKILYLTGFHEMARAVHDSGEHAGKVLTKPILPGTLRKEIAAALAQDGS